MKLSYQGLAAIVLLSLAACAGSGPKPGEPEGLSFADARALVLQNRSRLWKDPDSIRDARISPPYACTGGMVHLAAPPTACVCIEANARNSLGGYTGLKQNAVLFSGRQVIDIIETRWLTDKCDNMAAFPELNGSAPQRR